MLQVQTHLVIIKNKGLKISAREGLAGSDVDRQRWLFKDKRCFYLVVVFFPVSLFDPSTNRGLISKFAGMSQFPG